MLITDFDTIPMINYMNYCLMAIEQRQQPKKERTKKVEKEKKQNEAICRGEKKSEKNTHLQIPNM